MEEKTQRTGADARSASAGSAGLEIEDFARAGHAGAEAPRRDCCREKSRKKPLEQIIDEAAEKGARMLLGLQRQRRNTNFYRVTERLLRSYKKYQLWEEKPEEYGFFPRGKSHDISVAPPPGSGMRDKVELNEEFVEARKRSYERTMARYFDIKAVVEQFKDREEFIVIRMYYFGENVHGKDRGSDAHHYSFEEIAEELKSIGMERNVKTIRAWRTKLVQDMTVLLFGVDGAVSIEARDPKQGQPEEGQ